MKTLYVFTALAVIALCCYVVLMVQWLRLSEMPADPSTSYNVLTVNLVDKNGNVVRTTQTDKTLSELNTPDLPFGIYKVVTGAGRQVCGENGFPVHCN